MCYKAEPGLEDDQRFRSTFVFLVHNRHGGEYVHPSATCEGFFWLLKASTTIQAIPYLQNKNFFVSIQRHRRRFALYEVPPSQRVL